MFVFFLFRHAFFVLLNSEQASVVLLTYCSRHEVSVAKYTNQVIFFFIDAGRWMFLPCIANLLLK